MSRQPRAAAPRLPQVLGSCLCGSIKYRIDGPLADFTYCHCSICRKSHGTAFRARALIRTADFHLLSGKELITYYESTPDTRRGFCRRCGSPILTRFGRNPAYLGLPLGALDTDPAIRPAKHVHVTSKAAWFSITDDLPQFPEGPVRKPPGRGN